MHVITIFLFLLVQSWPSHLLPAQTWFITPYFVRFKALKLADLRSFYILYHLYDDVCNKLAHVLNQKFLITTAKKLCDTLSLVRLLSTRELHITELQYLICIIFTVKACRLWDSFPSNVKTIERRFRFVSELKYLYIEWISAAGWFSLVYYCAGELYERVREGVKVKQCYWY